MMASLEDNGGPKVGDEEARDVRSTLDAEIMQKLAVPLTPGNPERKRVTSDAESAQRAGSSRLRGRSAFHAASQLLRTVAVALPPGLDAFETEWLGLIAFDVADTVELSALGSAKE